MMLGSISCREKPTSQHDSQQQESLAPAVPPRALAALLPFPWLGYMSYSGSSIRVPLSLNHHELIVLARRVLAQTSSLKPGYKDEK